MVYIKQGERGRRGRSRLCQKGTPGTPGLRGQTVRFMFKHTPFTSTHICSQTRLEHYHSVDFVSWMVF